MYYRNLESKEINSETWLSENISLFFSWKNLFLVIEFLWFLKEERNITLALLYLYVNMSQYALRFSFPKGNSLFSFFDFLCNLTITEKYPYISGSKHGFKSKEKKVIYWIWHPVCHVRIKPIPNSKDIVGIQQTVNSVKCNRHL